MNAKLMSETLAQHHWTITR